jgi:hypothetical protein
MNTMLASGCGGAVIAQRAVACISAAFKAGVKPSAIARQF